MKAREDGESQLRNMPGPKVMINAPAIISLVVATAAASHAQVPDGSGTRGDVTIYRDDWGVPHVYAAREEHGFFGLGYAQAEDRLESMLRFYLAVRGEQAAHFGSAFVDVDFEELQYRHLVEARAGFARLPPQLQKDYRYFVAGVQRFMRDHPDRVPVWTPPLEPALPVAAMRSLLWGRTIFDELVKWRRRGPREGKCARAGAESPARHDDGGPEARLGSNQWILMPWRTADNVLIHLSDPHGGFGAYEFRIDAGPMKAATSNFPSFALPFIGHTRHMAWAFTLGGPDVSDCYAVTVARDNPRRYRFDNAWREMIVEEATVRVAGGDPVTRALEYTRHNGVLSPVVARRGDTAYVVSIPMMHDAGIMDEALYRMSLATNMREFREALQGGLFAVNLMAGGADGNSLYARAGRVPIRPPGYDWSRPVPGNTSATAWRGVHPFEDLVRVENPPLGYMQNNNIAPDMMIAHGAPAADVYQSYVFNDEPGRTNTRARRAIELLSGAYAATVEDALEMALDEKWVDTERWQAALRTSLQRQLELMRESTPGFRRFVHRLLHFDGFARKESVAALNYFYWRTSLDSVPGATLAEAVSLAERVAAGRELSSRQDTLLIRSVARALERMLAEHGRLDLRYGDIFRVGRGGYSWPLGGGRFVGAAGPRGPRSVTGDWAVVPLRAMGFTPPDSLGRRWGQGGQYHTTLTVFTDPIQSFSAAPFGQSEVPSSRYYTNQARLISHRRLKPTYFYQEHLRDHVVAVTTLDVDRRPD